mgnify:CR=1 FL=1
MGLILNLETTTKNCSVSLAKEGRTLACRELAENGFSHAEQLQPFIDQVLIESGYSLTDLEAVAISEGPGSYTGLRIGTSLAKGLCYALDVPLIAVDTLKAQAMQLDFTEGAIVSVIDARRMEVYQAIFDKDYRVIIPTTNHVIESDSYADLLGNGKVYFIGDAIDKIKTIIKHPNAIFSDQTWPSAIQMTSLSFEKMQNKDFEDLAYFEPYYLKDFITMNPPPK